MCLRIEIIHLVELLCSGSVQPRLLFGGLPCLGLPAPCAADQSVVFPPEVRLVGFIIKHAVYRAVSDLTDFADELLCWQFVSSSCGITPAGAYFRAQVSRVSALLDALLAEPRPAFRFGSWGFI